jgi:geranylgeranyl pyrophosphate synthase
MENADPEAIEAFSDLWKKRSLSDEDIESIKSLFSVAGTFDRARTEVSHRIERAIGSLRSLGDSEARNDLEWLALKMKERVA